jgi:hypothetical protein
MPRQRGPGHLGPFGNACMSCFKAKCKCVARPDGPGCQRCHRLKKPCQPSDSTKTGASRRRETERIAQLEKKLDGLISRLETRPRRRKRPPANSNAENKGQSPRAVAEDEDEENSEDYSVEENMNDADGGEADDDREDDDHSVQLSGPILDDDTRKVENETKVLGMFRLSMLPHFPFFSLDDRYHEPSGVYQLARERPLLWRAILCVASRQERTAKSIELRHALAKALLYQHEESEADRMDLLLSLLTYLSWGWDHKKRTISRLTLQAMSLACEMMHSPNPEPACEFDACSFGVISNADGTAGNTRVNTTSGFLESNRAVLGCFVLSSAAAAFLDHSIDALHWTPELNEGLAALDANIGECPSDSILTAQVRLHLLSQKAVNIRGHQQLGQAHTLVPADGTNNDHLVTLAALQADAEALALRSPAPSADPNPEVSRSRHRHLAHASATELVIGATRYQILAARPFILKHFGALNSNSQTATDNRPGPRRGERAQCLWACVDAAQRCATNLLSLADADFAGLSLVQWAQMVRSLALLHFVTVACQDPYPFWDRAAARAAVDLPAMLDRVAEKVVAAAAVASEQLSEGPAAPESESEGSLAGIASRLRSFGAQVRDAMARERVEEAGQGVNANRQPAAIPWIVRSSEATSTWRI